MPFDDLEKVSTQKNNKILNEDLTLEEILQTTKDINMILDHIGKKTMDKLFSFIHKISSLN